MWLSWVTFASVFICLVLIMGLAGLMKWREMTVVRQIRELKDSQAQLLQVSIAKIHQEMASLSAKNGNATRAVKQDAPVAAIPNIPARQTQKVSRAEAELLLKVNAAIQNDADDL